LGRKKIMTFYQRIIVNQEFFFSVEGCKLKLKKKKKRKKNYINKNN